jgi:Fur family ferric uptake transcriptional regulator
MDEAAIFERYLRSHGYNATSDRKAIAGLVFSLHEHFTAEDLVTKLKASKKHVSRASVYRTLNLLVESGFVRRFEMGGQAAYYEHVFGHCHHDHLICLHCGQVTQLEDSNLERAQREACARMGFRIEDHYLEIYGICKDCASEKGTKT